MIRRPLLIAMLFAAQAANGQQPSPKNITSVPKRDVSGLWHYQGTGGSEPIAPDNMIPPMTPWAKARFDAEITGYQSCKERVAEPARPNRLK